MVKLPRGWKLEKQAALSEPISLTILLKQPRMDDLKSRLEEISDPAHPEYGHHFSREQLEAYRAADLDAVQSVYAWLEKSGFENMTVSNSSISFTDTVFYVEDLFNTTVGHYSFDNSATRLRAESYSIPESLSGYIDFIHPLTHFMPPTYLRLEPHPLPPLPPPPPPPDNPIDVPIPPDPSAVHSRQSPQPCPSGLVTPSCLKTLYNLTTPPPPPLFSPSPVHLGITGFLDQYINAEDVSTFLSKHAPDLHAANYSFSVILVNNGTNPQTPLSTAGLEASLDMQYAMALGYPSHVTYYSVGGRGAKLDAEGKPIDAARSDNEPYLEFLEYLLALPDTERPQVLSISYADDEQSVPYPYAVRVCDLFAQLTARGTTVLVASGDGGVMGTGQNGCYSNDGLKTEEFIPTFPASCPYVTAVGATGEQRPFQGMSFSAGGFSNYFEAPGWQKTAIEGYIQALTGNHVGLYNNSGRAVPDLSAVGTGFVIEWRGEETGVLGTSASTPVVAAVMARINEARLRAGRNSTGWLNPAIYLSPVRQVWEDVVGGTSQGCMFGTEIETGFEALAGYDCVTGVGTIGDFDSLLALLG
ncbi:peptidase S8/S53 domain-containing protein [Pseudomassariella vexata]|uniref:tripeptidyl-peptidase II n=1 Tax=Pseudomassariella vexata TaxID=1141098 RepID=A0A1Y2EG09_9PEZI|nr:peptidase S8/S53 domain-containing protein [Pseudomassariella vexata]ORY70518.1 peptidase S8/S53 domain-containing protein [Pseudomassariella vexata]